MAVKLSPKMTVTAFDHGYWYAIELKALATQIGIPSAGSLRKDELELAIRRFLRQGTIGKTTARQPPRSGVRDVDRGLRLSLPVVNYTNDAATKAFLERQATKRAPGMKRRSGARYRLNRWRDDRLRRGVAITYRDLVDEYVRLCRPETPYRRIPHGRYINFMSDFLALEPNASRTEAIRAWRELKRLAVRKDYRSWVRAGRRRSPAT